MALFFGHNRAGLADPALVVFLGDLLEGVEQLCGAFVLYAVRNGRRVGGVCFFHAGSNSSLAGHEPRNIADGGAGFLQQVKGLLKVGVCFAGESHNQVCTEGEQREFFLQLQRKVTEVLYGVLAVHELQNALAPALDRNVQELVEPFVLKTFQQSEDHD